MKYRKQWLAVLLVVLLTFAWTSCYKKETFTFKEGTYRYAGEQIVFYQDIHIKEIRLNFARVTDAETNANILTNRKNKETYHVDLYIGNENGEGRFCSFTALGKIGDQVDRYYIEADVSDYINVENARLSMVLTITNPDHYYHNDREDDTEATQIRIDLKTLKINGTPVGSNDFPAVFGIVLNFETGVQP